MIMALLTAMASAAKAGQVGDTIVIEKADKVKIETRDTVQRIVISGAKDDPQFHYVQRIAIPDTSAVRRSMKSVKDFNKIALGKKDGKASKWEGSVHLHVGMGALLNVPDGYDFRLWPSFEIGFSFLSDFRPYGKQNVWSTGLGFNWHNYGIKDKRYLTKNAADMLVQYESEAMQDNSSSSLSVFSLQLPVLYTHYFDSKQKWGLTLGALLNWNISAYANRDYDIGDEHFDVSMGKIGQQPFTVEGLAMVRMPSFPDIYCRYSPMKLFKDGRGPKAHQLTFGFYW